MKRNIFIYLLPLVAFWGVSRGTETEPGKPDYFTYQEDGNVKTRGVYETANDGRVTKFTVYDEEGRLKYSEIPYYSPDGALIRADRLDSAGEIFQVIVFYDSFLVILDSEGAIVETQPIKQPKG